MKIVFLCSSLEPGRDGVGDYTKLLAYEIIRQGHEASVIALSDQFINQKIEFVEKLDNNDLPVLRLPEQILNKERFTAAKAKIANFEPDYISLQFVIYGFHPKGLPFNLGKWLASIGKNVKWHIMFHEIWPGITRLSPVKHKIYGFFQRQIIKGIINKIDPKYITTSNKLYEILLRNNSIDAKILPLFSNIPIFSDNQIETKAILQSIGVEGISKYLMIGIFGTLYPEVKLDEIIELKLLEAKNCNKKLMFISFGRIGESGLYEYNRLEKIFDNRMQFTLLGELSQKQISAVFQIIQLGISCTPVQHIGKSGVFAAMRLHGVSVIAPANDPVPEYDAEIKIYNEYLFQREPYKWDVNYITKKIVALLN